MIISRFFIAVVCLVALVSAGCAPKPTKGVRVTLQVAPNAAGWPTDAKTQQAVMEDAKACLMRRLALKDNSDCVIQADKIVVTVPGPTDAKAVAGVVESTKTGSLEFYYLKNVRSVSNPLGEWQMNAGNGSGHEYIFTGPHGMKLNSLKQPELVLSKVVNTAINKPILTGKDIIPNAKAGINSRQNINISIEFSKVGKEIFGEFTRKHVNDTLAIFYNGKLLTAPNINEAIMDGQAEITGFANLPEARIAAEMLKSGALPVPMKLIKTEIVKL